MLILLQTTLRRPLFVRQFSQTQQKQTKSFDYQAFEEEIRQQRQRAKNQGKSVDQDQGDSREQSDGQQSKAPSQVILSTQVAKDLTLLNVPKYVSKADLKKQYHKLAKMYHPDILSSNHLKQHQPEGQRQKMEDRFKDFNQAYERLLKWVEERDKTLDDDLANDRRPGVRVNKEDGSVTYTLGKLQIEGKRSTLDRQQLLLEMIEDDLTLKEPVNLRRNLFILWALFGIWIFYKDFKGYYQRMSEPRPGVDYDSYRVLIS